MRAVARRPKETCPACHDHAHVFGRLGWPQPCADVLSFDAFGLFELTSQKTSANRAARLAVA
jgi:hypothetical protein